MTTNSRRDKAWLLATAKAVAAAMKEHSAGTRLRIRVPARTTATNTDGWAAIIGDLGENQPRLEIWLDRFSGYPDRKLYACFRSESRRPVAVMTERVSQKLWPVRVVNPKDTDEVGSLVLTERLKRSEFGAPIHEKYRDGWTYYGIYDPTRETATRVNLHFCSRAVAFFEDVARALPHASLEDEQREIYPRVENRKHVASHLLRERSRLLATERKIRDDYTCRVCGLRFADTYGRLGIGFAEAHHLVPLGTLREKTRTSIDDLATVCANCHRMLHRMDGKRDDLKRLKTIVRNHRQK
mgnify:CR=1 FL=1